jgi:hypothetical protein
MSEKKWFIYVQDHHEGPFTVEEIWKVIDGGRASKTGYVWADGMKDWVALATLPEFNRTPAPAAPVAPVAPVAEPVAPVETAPAPVATEEPSNWQVEPQTATTEVKVESEGEEIQAAAIAPIAEEPTLTRTGSTITSTPVVEEATKTSVIEIASLEDQSEPNILRPAVLGVGAATRPSTQGPGEKNPIITSKMKPFIYAVLVLFVLIGLQRAGFLKGVEDRIASALSTLPELSDVNADDYEELKKTAKASISEGPQVALALSKSDPLSPIFYVSTNLPDGARFEIYVEGVPHRLLNTLSYSGKLDVTTSKRLAKSAPLRYPDGKPISRGEYMIYVMEAPVGQPDLVYKELLSLAPIARNLPNQLPQDRRLVYTKKIFFGTKDATYEQRLKEFHDGLVNRAKAEAIDLAQVALTLESQALVSTSTYDRLKRQPIGPRQKQVWNEMNRTWRPIEAQIIQKYSGMAPEQIKENFFHSNLVSEFLAVEKVLAELHSAQEKLFTTSASAASLNSEISSLRSYFEKRRAAWKAAIDRAVATPSNPETGLPVAVKIESTESNAPETGGGNG